MTFFKDNFWGEKQAGFDVLYHNMKHGQLATKELAEYVRERAAIEEGYSKSMSRLAKIASNGSPLGTFAPMWDVFRVAAEKLALCHLELARKMSDLIREISKCSEEQAKVHRKVKEESTGTVEAIQSLQVQAAQLQKSQENYQSKCAELERLRREGAPQKDLEKAELKSKKAAESLLSCIEKHNRVGGDFELKMSKSAQRFQDIEEAHLRQMKLLIRAYSHSIEDTNVQVGQVHNEFMQNTENISAETLLERFAEQRGTGKERPTLVAFEEYSPSAIPEGAKRSRGKTFRIPGLGRKSKEPDSMDSAATETPDSAGVDEEGYMVPSGISQDGFSQGERSRCCSSDSDFDDEEPKKFQVQIRPLSGSGSSDPVASELELRATVGTLTLPPSRRVLMKRHVLRVSSYTAGRCSDRQRCEVPYRGWAQDGAWGSASSSSRSRVSSTLSGSDTIFGPPLETAFADATFSSDSSSPENVQDSGLDSPSHQPPGPSPEPRSWAAFGGHAKDPQCPCSEWSLPVQWKSNRIPLMDPWDGRGGDLSGSCGSPLQLDCPDDPFSITLLGSPTHQSKQWEGGDSLSQASVCCSRRELLSGNTTHNPFSERVSQCDSLRTEPQHGVGANTQSKCKTDSSVPQLLSVPDRQSTERRGGAAFGIKDNRTDWSSCEQDKTMCPSPPTGSSPIPSECKSHLQVTSPAQGLSRGSSPMSVTPQEIWPVAAAFTEYISACFPGGEDSRCLLKISGDLTMSFPAQFTRILSTNHNIPVLSFLLVLPSGVEQLLPNNNLLYSKPSQSKTEGKVFLFNMEKLRKHLQREAELNPRTSYHNVSLLKYQVSSQDPSRAPLLLSAECQRSGTVTRVSLQYWRCLTAAPGAQLSGLRALLPLEHGASDLQCQPPAAWNVEENRVLWQLPDFCVNREHGSLCASWQSLDAQRHPPPSLALQFIGFGASVSGVDVELLGSHYHMSLLKRRFTTGRYITCCSL